MALPDASQSNVPMLIHPEKIRKAWHKDEWYYSVVDIIAELLEKDTQQGSTYWRKLKSRLIAEGNETVTQFHRLKLHAEDGKMRLTDVADEKLCSELANIVQRVSYHRANRIARQIDELTFIQPMVIHHFQTIGWLTTHPVSLASGKIIDIIAQRGEEIYLVECKRELQGSEIFRAVGQVLCYAAEYGKFAKPAIACLAGKADDYAYMSCQALGISIIEINPQES